MKKMIMVILMVVMVSMVGCNGIRVESGDDNYIYCYDGITDEYLGYVYINNGTVITQGTTDENYKRLSKIVMEYFEEEGIDMNWEEVQ